jgi:hypothetical protein
MRLELDRLICDSCETRIDLETENPIPRWIADLEVNAKANFVLLRPPFTQLDLPVPRLYSIYREAYFNALFGMYNASIVLLGVLLEAVTKETIYLKEGKEFKGDFGEAISHAKNSNYLQIRDCHFLDRFRKKIRNIYQHADAESLLRGIFVPAWKIELGKDVHKSISTALMEIKEGKRKPTLTPAWVQPISDVTKETIDQKYAIKFFNDVHDFLIGAKVKYFSEREFEEYRKKYGKF